MPTGTTIRGTTSVTDAFDAEVLISAASIGPRAPAAQAAIESSMSRIGSVVLLPEVLSKPLRTDDLRERNALVALLSTFDLKPVDEEIADAAVTLGAKYRLRAPDAIHLATAVVWGAARFHTNNRKDFGPGVTEIEVVWPDMG